LFFHESLRRDAKGEIVEFNADPSLIEQFGQEAGAAIRERIERGDVFAVVTTPEARPYVKMIIGRLFSALPILSHLEIARGVEIKSLGTIS
jgi:flagellar biosynthesis protein FlhA